MRISNSTMPFGLFEELQKKTSGFDINEYVKVKASSCQVTTSSCQPLNYTNNAGCVIQINPKHAWYTKIEVNEAWLEFDIESINKFVPSSIIGYIIQVFDNCNYPTKWKFSGKNENDEQWEEIDKIHSGEKYVESGGKVRFFTKHVVFSKYRLDFLSTKNSNFHVGLKFFDLLIGKRLTECICSKMNLRISIYTLLFVFIK